MIWLASRNRGKVKEFARLLAGAELGIRALPQDVGDAPETGVTFEENALQKAMYYGQRVDGWVLADDSGLCVDALDGQPGVYSARFAGESATDRANNELLLKLLCNVPEHERTASFVCVLALWRIDERDPVVVRGEVHGRILRTPQGSDGFGYDPLFAPTGADKSFAELSLSEKNRYSHRAVAVARLLREVGGDMLEDLRRQ